MSYEEDLLDDPKEFLKNHAVMVDCGMDQKCATAAKVREQLSMRPTGGDDPCDDRFDFTGGSVHAKIVAPRMYAYFKQTRQAERPDIVPWSVDQINVKVDNAPMVGDDYGMPFYLIPYDEGRTIGVRLPAGNEPAIALTATQNGCTLEVSGDATQPYVSHSNVINVPSENRQSEIISRAQELQLAFRNALPDDADEELLDPGRNRAQFGHYTQIPELRDRIVDYTTNTRFVAGQLVDVEGNPVSIKGARRGRGIKGHARYHLTPIQYSIDTLREVPSQALAVGMRRGGRWTFYHQSWGNLSFRVSEHRKVGKIPAGNVTLDSVHATVVFSTGTIWPERTVEMTNFR